MIFALIVVAVVLAQAGDWSLRHAVGINRFFWLGVLFYAVSAYPVWASYRRGSWFEVALLWTIIAIVLSIFTGSVVIGEKMVLQQWMAFILAAAAGVLWYSKAA